MSKGVREREKDLANEQTHDENHADLGRYKSIGMVSQKKLQGRRQEDRS